MAHDCVRGLAEVQTAISNRQDCERHMPEAVRLRVPW